MLDDIENTRTENRAIMKKKKPRGKGRPFVKGDPRAKPFKPGQSGNPGGRTKSAEVSKAIRYILTLADIDSFVPETVAERLALVRIKQSLLKTGRADAEFVVDRAEGKPTATVKSIIDLTGTRTEINILEPPTEKDLNVLSETEEKT